MVGRLLESTPPLGVGIRGGAGKGDKIAERAALPLRQQNTLSLSKRGEETSRWRCRLREAWFLNICFAQMSTGRFPTHVERAHVPHLVGSRWCEIYTLRGALCNSATAMSTISKCSHTHALHSVSWCHVVFMPCISRSKNLLTLRATV